MTHRSHRFRSPLESSAISIGNPKISFFDWAEPNGGGIAHRFVLTVRLAQIPIG